MIASTVEGQSVAGSTAIATSATTAGSSDTAIVRQPPIDTDTESAAATNPTLDAQVVENPTRDRRRSSSVTLSPPTLSPAPGFEQSQSVPLSRGRAASLQRAASSQRQSQRPPSLSPTQWTGSYGSSSPPIGSDIETEYPAARPTVYQPWSTGIDNASLQVVADTRQPGSTVDPCIYIPEMSTFVTSAANEAQPDILHVASTRPDTPIPTSDVGKRGYVVYSQVPPSSSVDVAPSPIIVAARHQLPVTVPMSRRQSKSSVPIGTNEPVLGSVREESQLGVTGPTSMDAGQSLSKGIDVVRPTPAHVAPTYDTPMHASMSAGEKTTGNKKVLSHLYRNY